MKRGVKLEQMLPKIAGHVHQAAARLAQVVKMNRSHLRLVELGREQRIHLTAHDCAFDLCRGVDTDDRSAVVDRIEVVGLARGIDRDGASPRIDRTVCEIARIELRPLLLILRMRADKLLPHYAIRAMTTHADV